MVWFGFVLRVVVVVGWIKNMDVWVLLGIYFTYLCLIFM